MNNIDKTFGSFLRQKRLEKSITLRKFASLLGLSPVHMSNLETDRRPAPKSEMLVKIATQLNFDKAEIEEMYDLAARSKVSPTVSNDLPEYIMENDLARMALRTAKDVDATDLEWQEFIEKLRKRSENTHKKAEDG
jgi:transcriptional regulator with XRE-family HTH domain